MKKRVIGWRVRSNYDGEGQYLRGGVIWTGNPKNAMLFQTLEHARRVAKEEGDCTVVCVVRKTRRITEEELETACDAYDSIDSGGYDNCDRARLSAALATLGIEVEG